MKKARKSKLHVERDVLRVLQVKELRQVDGGSDTIVRLPVTSDSQVACCC
jgi:hypothetical protein